MDFQLNNAKAYFKQGLFERFIVVRHEGLWTVKLIFKDSNMTAAHIIDARHRKIRTFKSIESALDLAAEVGFTIDNVTTC
jgi:hypothetical protein